MRWDHPLARFHAVLVNGLLQSRMVAREWKPGVMHAVIFLGFMTLLVRKVQLLVIGYDETFVYPGNGGWNVRELQGLVEIAVLSAVGYALWRRLVQKPARLERNREALLILSLIAAIMITDFLRRFPLRALATGRPGDRARAIVRASPEARSPGCFRDCRQNSWPSDTRPRTGYRC